MKFSDNNVIYSDILSKEIFQIFIFIFKNLKNVFVNSKHYNYLILLLNGTYFFLIFQNI